jgi:hypothetical protein
VPFAAPLSGAVFPVQFPFSAAGTLNASPNIHRPVFDRVSRSLAFQAGELRAPVHISTDLPVN